MKIELLEAEKDLLEGVIDILLSEDLSPTLAFNIAEQFLLFYNENPKSVKYKLERVETKVEHNGGMMLNGN